MIIALSGKKGHGKTTAANMIKNILITESEHPVKVERINFKDSLIEEIKKNCIESLDFLSEVYEMGIEELFSQKPLGMRALMKDYGLMRRGENLEYWINRWEEKVKASSADYIIVDDCRFLNELHMVGKLGGKVLKIVKTDEPVSDDLHPTEIEMDLFPITTYSLVEATNHEELEEELRKQIL